MMKTLEFIPFERAQGIRTFNTFAIEVDFSNATDVVEALITSNNIYIDEYEKVIIYEAYGEYLMPVDVIWFHDSSVTN